ncbi:MAG: hypothetical protein A3H49_13145 [Nitrospirae bacterium RIFCSPLOWO2_02_FULL_62_14]|nr:MAG: hypothetical protein A3H49_13145 [Nitrospirae bacterium RIFCSPLOWO2_02_FULL_62_14]
MNKTGCVLMLALAGPVLWSGCADRQKLPEPPPLMGEVPDTRTPVHLPQEADRAHREVMMQHLETVQVLVGALADEDFTLAKGVMEAHVGFFARRHVITRQKMEAIPPAYQTLALAHVQAGKELAAIIPTRDMKQILPRLNGMLKTCMACHLEYKVGEPASR